MNPRKPTALKILNGSDAHDPQRRNHLEPKVEPLTEVPAPPAFMPLVGRARRAWDDLAPRLIRLGVLAESDLPLLASVCRSYAEYEVARRDGDGWRRAEAAQRRFEQGLRAFGLSPSDRARVHATPKANDDPMTDLLRRKPSAG